MQFVNDLKKTVKFEGEVQISKLPQLYRCSIEFAKLQDNAELNRILALVPLTGKYKYVSIDSRSHMLMKGMFPCIPGWHCDDFYRPEYANGQPDLEGVNEAAPAIHHLLVLGDCSRTEFLADDSVVLPSPQEIIAKHGSEDPIYLHYDQLIEKLNPKTILVEPNQFYTFGPTAFHRGSGATHNGWRYFLRVTESNHRQPKNELRYQTQVYTNGRVSW